jgi:small subunit ribosomal protein S20
MQSAGCELLACVFPYHPVAFAIMAITSSAKRAIRVSARKAVFNARRMNTMRDGVKSIKKMALGKDFKGAEKALSAVYKAIDKAAKRGVIKKNTAARKKSRVVAFIKKQSAKSK